MLMYDYYYWLLDKIAAYEDYQELLQELYSIPYTWTHELDKNREIAGLQLREEFAYNTGIELQDVAQAPCSVLEALIGLAKYMSEIYGYTIPKWFWEMINNLQLHRFSDGYFSKRSVDKIIQIWLQGRYSFSGIGSPFPLRVYDEDARKMQLFDMMQAYINENYPVDKNWLD